MKKITLLFVLLLTFVISGFSQSYTSGPIMVATDYTVQFDVDVTNDLVTITLIGPDDVWLGVSPGTASGNSMGNLGDDAIIYHSVGLQDRNMPAGTGTPNLDAEQNLTLASNTTSGGLRTLVITRLIDTGDSNDYIFPSTATTFPFLWALDNNLTLDYHNGGRGGAMANMVLSNDEFQQEPSFTISPNPARERMNIDLNPRIQNARLQVYDVLGKRVVDKEISDIDASVNVSSWNSGIYIVRVISGDLSETKRFVKQ